MLLAVLGGALIGGLVGGSMHVLSFLSDLFVDNTSTLNGVLVLGLGYGLGLGLQLGLQYGGGAAINHYALRWVMRRDNLLPLRLVLFLNAMDKRILVQRAGAHYRFIHRTFQEHLAVLTDEDIERLALVD